jgi:outer membrane protein TolC
MGTGRRIFIWLGGILALGWAWCAFPPPAQARDLTLAQAVQLAWANDPDTRHYQEKVEIGKLKRSKAVQDFFPRLDYYVTQGPQVDYFGRPVTDKNLFYTGVGMEQPLYKGGTLTKGLRLAETDTRKQEKDYQARRLAVAAEAIAAYYQVLSGQALVQNYEALLRQGEEDLREAQARQAAGTGTRLEVLELSVKVLEVQQKLSKAKAQQRVQLAALRKVTGVEENLPLSLHREFPLQDIRGDLHALLNEAQSRRPDLASGREEITYQQLRTDIEKGKRWPQLSLVARYEWEDPQLFQGRKDWLVFLKASISFGNTSLNYEEQRTHLYPNVFAYPPPPGQRPQAFEFSVRTFRYSIFDRSSNKVEVEEARATRDYAQRRWQQLRRQVDQDVKEAYALKEDSANRMATAQKQVAMAREMVQINRTKYAAGMATLAEVFKARATLTEAEVNLATAQNDKAAALGKLYQAVGRELNFGGGG